MPLDDSTRAGDVSAAAHLPEFAGDSNQLDESCERTLQGIRSALLAGHDADVLSIGTVSDPQRYCACREPLHAGTPMAVLVAHGTWGAGSIEYELTDRGPRGQLWFSLPGFAPAATHFDLPAGVVVRLVS